MKSFLDAQWSTLLQHPQMHGKLRTIGVGKSTKYGDVQLALDYSGRRAVLIPVAPDGPRALDTISRGIHVLEWDNDAPERRRRTVLIRCESAEYWAVFNDFLSVLLDNLSQYGEHPSSLLAEWRAALASQGVKYSREDILGLWGELRMLVELQKAGEVSLSAWTAMDRSLKDFTFRNALIEVKTTTTTSPRRVHISGIEQLESVPGRELFLAVFLVDTDPTASSVPDLVAEVLSGGAPLEQLNAALNARGFEPEDLRSEPFISLKLRLRNQALWKVTNQFPAITRSSLVGGLPTGVLSMSYEVSLESIWSTQVEQSLVADTLRGIVNAT